MDVLHSDNQQIFLRAIREMRGSKSLGQLKTAHNYALLFLERARAEWELDTPFMEHAIKQVWKVEMSRYQ